MKKLLFLLFFLTVITRLIYCQNAAWQTYSLDSLMHINMPGDVIAMDTTTKDFQSHQIMSKFDNTIYIAQKSEFNNPNIDENLSPLPYDNESLEKFYEDAIRGMIKTVPAIFSKKQAITVDGFNGYQIEFVDSLNNLICVNRLYLLNKHLYNLTIFNFQGLDTTDFNMFFNSIELHHKESISQFQGQSQAYRIGYLTGTYIIPIIIIVGVIIWLIKRKKK